MGLQSRSMGFIYEAHAPGLNAYSEAANTLLLSVLHAWTSGSCPVLDVWITENR